MYTLEIRCDLQRNISRVSIHCRYGEYEADYAYHQGSYYVVKAFANLVGVLVSVR